MHNRHSRGDDLDRAAERDHEREPSLRSKGRRTFRNATEQREQAHENLTIRFGGSSDGSVKS